MIEVIDYKAGNLTSVLKALNHLDAETHVTQSPDDVLKADKIVLPGVGNFAATRRLDETYLTPAIREAIKRGTPFLGICVGMQWLLQGSTEAPEQPGLGYFAGQCARFPEGTEKVPHVGWDHLLPRTDPPTRLLAGIRPTEGGEYAYFTHSYYVPKHVLFKGEGPSITNPTAAVTHYVHTFVSAVEHENVFGVQFHPEKSGETGLKILKNFLEL
jgi:glutamine amidotransferase